MPPPSAAADTDLVTALANLVNQVYAESEDGMWLDGATRTSPGEIAGLVTAGGIVVARGRPPGSARREPSGSTRTGRPGGLSYRRPMSSDRDTSGAAARRGSGADLAFDALADPVRREILAVLAEDDECSAGALADRIDSVGRTAVSTHLRVLRVAGLLTERREGRYRYYSIDPTGAAAEVMTLLGVVPGFTERRAIGRGGPAGTRGERGGGMTPRPVRSR